MIALKIFVILCFIVAIIGLFVCGAGMIIFGKEMIEKGAKDWEETENR